MTTRQKLWLFKRQFMMSKEDVISSFIKFIKDNEAGKSGYKYSKSKREALKNINDLFYYQLEKTEIPDLDDWWFYGIEISNESCELFLCHCEEIEYDEDGFMIEMLSKIEYSLITVECDYLSVEEYSKLYGVTATTVRQWIRRGKLRSAKKVGGEWLIPELADKPGRGYESATYSWENRLPECIVRQFTFLEDSSEVFIEQDETDKSRFFYKTDSLDGMLSTEAREKLELALLSCSDIEVEEGISEPITIFDKQIFASELSEYEEMEFEYIIASSSQKNNYIFDVSNYSGDDFDCHTSYIIPISMSYRGVPSNLTDDELEDIFSGNTKKCPKIATLDAWLILCKQIIDEGENPYIICDDIDGDLEYVMSALTEGEGPLNKENGNAYQNLLYIHEIIVEKEYRRQGLGSRILSELSYTIADSFYNKPEIIAYFVAPTKNDWKDENQLVRENAVRYLANDKMSHYYESILERKSNDDKIINFSSHYRFTDDEINLALGRRHIGSRYPEELKNPVFRGFYETNGFIEAGNSRVYYKIED